MFLTNADQFNEFQLSFKSGKGNCSYWQEAGNDGAKVEELKENGNRKHYHEIHSLPAFKEAQSKMFEKETYQTL